MIKMSFPIGMQEQVWGSEDQLGNAPRQHREERAGEKFPAFTGQGATKEQRQGKSQKKPRCSGPRAQHIPCWGKIGQERERKQMREAIQ